MCHEGAVVRDSETSQQTCEAHSLEENQNNNIKHVQYVRQQSLQQP